MEYPLRQVGLSSLEVVVIVIALTIKETAPAICLLVTVALFRVDRSAHLVRITSLGASHIASFRRVFLIST